MSEIMTEQVDTDILRIKVIGYFNYQCAKSFQDTYKNRPEIGKYIVDFTDSERIDSSGLGMLIDLHEKVSPTGAIVELHNPNNEIMSLLKKIKFDKIFPITHT